MPNNPVRGMVFHAAILSSFMVAFIVFMANLVQCTIAHPSFSVWFFVAYMVILIALATGSIYHLAMVGHYYELWHKKNG